MHSEWRSCRCHAAQLLGPRELTQPGPSCRWEEGQQAEGVEEAEEALGGARGGGRAKEEPAGVWRALKRVDSLIHGQCL